MNEFLVGFIHPPQSAADETDPDSAGVVLADTPRVIAGESFSCRVHFDTDSPITIYGDTPNPGIRCGKPDSTFGILLDVYHTVSAQVRIVVQVYGIKIFYAARLFQQTFYFCRVPRRCIVRERQMAGRHQDLDIIIRAKPDETA